MSFWDVLFAHAKYLSITLGVRSAMMRLLPHAVLTILAAASGPPADVVDPLLAAFRRFDFDGDGIVRWNDLAIGLLSSAEIANHSYPEDHPFGASQCADPTLDEVSFVECEVARSRSAPDKTLEVNFTDEFNKYIAGCQAVTPAWLNGDCLSSCSECYRLSLQSPKEPHIAVAASKEAVPPLSNATKILISSDWHIEPWYLSTSKPSACGANFSKTCRFSGASLNNMFTCRDTAGNNVTCLLDGWKKDSPISMEESHLASVAVQPTTVHFFLGDTQAHAFKGSWNQSAAISTLLDRVLDEEVTRFGAANIVWTMGNDDGPSWQIFVKQDPSTLAWADALLNRGVVTDGLGIIYSGGINQTTMFRQTGFYCKQLLAISEDAYAIVLNTNLGGANVLQNRTLTETLMWISARHPKGGIVYLLGHHPSVMKSGVNIVPGAYADMVKGVFAGHVHYATSTDGLLFTQVPAITQCADVVAYWIATVSEAAPEVRLQTSQLYRYVGANRMPADPAMWSCAEELGTQDLSSS